MKKNPTSWAGAATGWAGAGSGNERGGKSRAPPAPLLLQTPVAGALLAAALCCKHEPLLHLHRPKQRTMSLFRFQNFILKTLHRIFRHMHRVLNKFYLQKYLHRWV